MWWYLEGVFGRWSDHKSSLASSYHVRTQRKDELSWRLWVFSMAYADLLQWACINEAQGLLQVESSAILGLVGSNQFLSYPILLNICVILLMVVPYRLPSCLIEAGQVQGLQACGVQPNTAPDWKWAHCLQRVCTITRGTLDMEGRVSQKKEFPGPTMRTLAFWTQLLSFTRPKDGSLMALSCSFGKSRVHVTLAWPTKEAQSPGHIDWPKRWAHGLSSPVRVFSWVFIHWRRLWREKPSQFF